MRIVIQGHAQCGKTAAAQAIVKALREAGMEVQVEDRDGDFGHPRPPEVLRGKQATVATVQLFRGDFFPPFATAPKERR